MNTWWWVRHGPTHQKVFTGWRDVSADLSDTAALDRLHGFLPDNALVVSSDLIRASKTADAISDGRSRMPDTPQLREFDFGVWDGIGFDAVSDRDPVLSRAFWEDPGDVAPPDGESWAQLTARIGAFVQDMNAQHSARDIIAVAHFGVILTQISVAGKLSPKAALAHKIDNLSVSKLRYDPHAALGPINHNP